MAAERPRPGPRNHVSGFTLIEVLVAALVLGIGLLGVATMQMVSLKNNNSAALRTQAVFLAQDIADRMRGNPGVAASAYSLDPNNPPTCPGSCDAPDIAGASGCSPADLAAYDICEWQDGIADNLPGGQGQLSLLNPPANNIYQARIMWDDERTGATGINCSGDPDVDLTCFDLEFRP